MVKNQSLIDPYLRVIMIHYEISNKIHPIMKWILKYSLSDLFALRFLKHLFLVAFLIVAFNLFDLFSLLWFSKCSHFDL